MIIGIYLTTAEDSISFESTMKRKAKIVSRLPKMKIELNLKLNFKNEEDKELLNESLRLSSEVTVIS